MRIIQGIHINGTDKKKRYWKVPVRLESLRIKKGDEVIVKTPEDFSRVKVTKVISTKNDVIKWKGGQLQVRQEILTTVSQEIDRKFIAKKD